MNRKTAAWIALLPLAASAFWSANAARPAAPVDATSDEPA